MGFAAGEISLNHAIMTRAVISLTSFDASGLTDLMVPTSSPERCQMIHGSFRCQSEIQIHWDNAKLPKIFVGGAGVLDVSAIQQGADARESLGGRHIIGLKSTKARPGLLDLWLRTPGHRLDVGHPPKLPDLSRHSAEQFRLVAVKKLSES